MAVSAKDIIRNYTVVIVLILFGLGLGGYYWSLHYKPFTQNAFLITNTRPVSPLVEGYLTEVLVKNHQKVKKGEPLFTIFRPPYELKVEDLTYAVKVEEARLAGIDAKLKAAKAQVEKDAAEAANGSICRSRRSRCMRSRRFRRPIPRRPGEPSWPPTRSSPLRSTSWKRLSGKRRWSLPASGGCRAS